MSNRNPVKQWFITYPQWLEDKNTVLETLLKNFESTYYKVCRETHEDGNFHYHIVLKLLRPQTKSQLLSKFKNMYPNNNKRIDVKPVRSIKHAIKYCSKEDPNPLESPGGYISARAPTNALATQFVRSIGYTSLNEFNNQRSEELRQESYLHSQFLNTAYSFEQLNMTFHDLYDLPHVNRFQEIRRKISQLNSIITPDDMTFFIKWYRKNYEILLNRVAPRNAEL